MWWLWPHFKRLWAAAGAIAIGLAINYLFALWGKQSVPSLRGLSDLLSSYWYWTGGALTLFAIVSVSAARAHRRHEAPHFIGATRSRRAHQGAKLLPLSAPTTAAATPIVGREDELTQLRDWFASALKGERRVVFVSGEAGIGKTTFVRAFLDSLEKDGAVRVGPGQCVEQYGAGEPYMPMLEALTQLSRGAEGPHLLALLHQLAPAWLAQLPALLTAEERARIQGETQGLTQQRMLREMAETLAALAADAPLVLLLEDLHWSDVSTLDLIAAIARRTEPARLLVLGTYRPVEVLAGDHPLRALKQELELHQQCEELRLKLLSEAEVATYLGRRFANDRAAQFGSLAPAIYQHSEGNPLFMVNVTDYLKAQGPQLDASKIETPRNIRQMIERNLQRLDSEEQAVLESASVAGAEFSAAAVAAALERPVSGVEACCMRLSRNEQFIRSQGASEWPDGTVALNVRFLHALYREVLYDHIPPGRRVELHRRIAECEETAYSERAGEIAAELANHYRRGNDRQKAVQYFQLAGERAAVRSAYAEAIVHFNAGIEEAGRMPEGPDRSRRQLALLLKRGAALAVIKGPQHPEAEETYLRARGIAQSLGDGPELFKAVWGQWLAANMRQTEMARTRAEELVELGSRLHDDDLLLEAFHCRWSTASFRGDVRATIDDGHEGIKRYDRARHDQLGAMFGGHDPGVCAHACQGLAYCLTGAFEQARDSVGQAVKLAETLEHPPSLVHALVDGAMTWQIAGDREATDRMARRAIELAEKYSFAHQRVFGLFLSGWAQAVAPDSGAGLTLMESEFAHASATAALRMYFTALLAEVSVRAGRAEEVLALLDHALEAVKEPGVGLYLPEIHRLRGECLMLVDARNHDQALLALDTALEIASRQGAHLLELRAATSRARLWASAGRPENGIAPLREIYARFTEGFEAPDLKGAKALLDQ